MIAIVVLSIVLVHASSAASASIPAVNQPLLMRNEHIYDNSGQFALAYALNDGTTQERQGALVPNSDGTGYVLNQQGSYSFITPEGVTVKMSYTAGKDGFKVTGHPLPTPVQPQ